jgi:glyoxylase-like metal-dependent hydrolase (beta-lactamase superfamily II)
MATPIPFVFDLDVEYGRCDRVAPRLRRVVADNPSKFTFKGTGTYLFGEGEVVVIDPGPRDPKHADAIVRAVAGEQVTHILITHTHGDHSPGAALLHERLGPIPTYGYGPHPATADDERAWAEANPDEPDDELDDAESESSDATGDEVKLEEGPDHDWKPDVRLAQGDTFVAAGWRFEALHTPGHISNHVCYAVDGWVFTGDHVMGWSTTIVPPPNGDMVAYLASLDLLLARDDATYFPTHGPPITEPHPYVAALKAHRLEREQQILEALAGGPTSIKPMVRKLYADVHKGLHKPAARSVLSHLVKLVAEGRVHCSDAEPRLRSVYSR